MAIEQCIESFLFSRQAAMRSPATVDCYRYTLGSLAKSLAVWPPSPQEIRVFLISCRDQGLSATTIQDHFDRLAVWFRWLVAEGLLSSNPMGAIERPSAPDLLPRGTRPRDVKAMIDYLQAECEGAWPLRRRDLALVSFLFDTGSRSIEARMLRRADLYLKRKFAIVLGKGGKERLVTFGRATKRALTGWLAVHPDPVGELVFVSAKGAPLSRFAVLRIVQRVARAAGVSVTVTPHRLRHAACLATLDLGANPVDVQAQFGHRDLSMTERYAKASTRHRAGFHDKHSPLDYLDDLAADDL